MPTCALKNCKSRYGKKTEHEVALFSFPLQQNSICQKWTQLVRLERGQDDWAPSGASKICSKHFKETDIHISKTGRKVLRKGSVPDIQCRDFQIEKTKYIRTLQAFRTVRDTLKNEDADIELMFDTPEIELTAVDHYLKEQKINQNKSYKLSPQKSTYYPGCKPGSCELKVCRICFSTNCQLLLLHDNMKLYVGYEAVTGQALADEEDLPPYLCTDCADQLVNCIRFRNRSLEAHLTLLDILKNKGHISLESIQATKTHTTDTEHTEKERKETDIQNDKQCIDIAATETKMVDVKIEDSNITTDVIKSVLDDVDTECLDITTDKIKASVNDVDMDNTDRIKSVLDGVNNKCSDITIDRIKAAVNDVDMECTDITTDKLKTEIKDSNMKCDDITTNELKTEVNDMTIDFEVNIIKTEVNDETKDVSNESTEKGDNCLKLDKDSVNPYTVEVNDIVKQEITEDELVNEDVDDSGLKTGQEDDVNSVGEGERIVTKDFRIKVNRHCKR